VSKFRYAMIGCGEIAVQTSESVLKSDAAEVVACMDVNESLAANLAARHGARHTTDLDDVLSDPPVQAVIISTPHFLHAPQAIAAAEAGKHVLVEKPIACDLAQADAMIAAAEAAGVKLNVLYPVRFSFPCERARELFAGGAIGRLIAVHLDFMIDKPRRYWTGGYSGRAKTDWRLSKRTSGGGITLMNMSHNLDALVHVLDFRPVRIYAEYDTLGTPGSEVEDTMAFVMRLDGGGIVSLATSSVAAGREPCGDRIYGERGQLHLAGRSLRVFLTEAWQDLPAGEWTEIQPGEDYRDGRRRHVEDFAEAVLADAEPPVPGRQGRRALEIVRGAYLSMERGGPVAFPVEEATS